MSDEKKDKPIPPPVIDPLVQDIYDQIDRDLPQIMRDLSRIKRKVDSTLSKAKPKKEKKT